MYLETTILHDGHVSTAGREGKSIRSAKLCCLVVGPEGVRCLQKYDRKKEYGEESSHFGSLSSKVSAPQPKGRGVNPGKLLLSDYTSECSQRVRPDQP